MKGPTQPPAHGRRGAAMLLWVVFIVFATFGSAVAISLVSKSAHDVAQLDRRKTEARSLSHAATEHACDVLSVALLNGVEPPAVGTATVDGVPVNYTITRATAAATQTGSSGIYEIVAAFQVEGTATVGNTVERTRRLIRGSVVPVFQFAMFWENDMMMFNPAEWTIKGRVHCNSKIFIEAWTQVTFDTNYLRAVDGIYGKTPYVLPNTPVAPLIRKWVVDPWDASEPVEYEPLDTKHYYDSQGIASMGGLDSDFQGYDADLDGNFLGPSDIMPFAPEVLERWAPPDLYPGGSGHTLQNVPTMASARRRCPNSKSCRCTRPPAVAATIFGTPPRNAMWPWRPALEPTPRVRITPPPISASSRIPTAPGRPLTAPGWTSLRV